ncbi:MAG: hypothetical protein U0172_00140 [Nitrospiraceae bacterium]
MPVPSPSPRLPSHSPIGHGLAQTVVPSPASSPAPVSRRSRAEARAMATLASLRHCLGARREVDLTGWGAAASRARADESARNADYWRLFDRDWQAVVQAGLQGSDAHEEPERVWTHRRLLSLGRRLAADHRGIRESAVAEVEMAGRLLRAGGAIRWLPESQARTADLECRFGATRLCVEVTAMVGAFRETHGIPTHRALFLHDPDGPLTDGDVLIHRMLARVSQKARQLADYREPVLLSLSVPPQEDTASGRQPDPVELDLRRLAGAVTELLLRLQHLSGVSLSLWSVRALPASSAIRLANVGLVERFAQQAEAAPVRMLVGNPAAQAPLMRGTFGRLRETL